MASAKKQPNQLSPQAQQQARTLGNDLKSRGVEHSQAKSAIDQRHTSFESDLGRMKQPSSPGKPGTDGRFDRAEPQQQEQQGQPGMNAARAYGRGMSHDASPVHEASRHAPEMNTPETSAAKSFGRGGVDHTPEPEPPQPEPAE